MPSIKKLMFARKSRIDGNPVFVMVECYNKDDALSRLVDRFKFTDKEDWDYLGELDPDSEMGPMGQTVRIGERIQ